MVKIIKANLLILSVSLIFLFGCREGIIPPDNPATNVNEPVQQSTRNSYTFTINAEKVSFNITDHLDLKSFRVRASFNVSDYSAGIADVFILSGGNIVYEGLFDNNLNGEYIELNSENLTTIRIRCQNFTGKLKIQLSSITN